MNSGIISRLQKKDILTIAINSMFDTDEEKDMLYAGYMDLSAENLGLQLAYLAFPSTYSESPQFLAPKYIY